MDIKRIEATLPQAITTATKDVLHSGFQQHIKVLLLIYLLSNNTCGILCCGCRLKNLFATTEFLLQLFFHFK